MRKIKSVFFVAVLFGLFLMPLISINAQTRYVATPFKGYVSSGGVQDQFFPDYVVEFRIPTDATNIVAYSTTNGVESRVFSYSTTHPNEGIISGRKVVRVVTGYRARHCSHSIIPSTWQCDYRGSIASWTNTVRLRYYR